MLVNPAKVLRRPYGSISCSLKLFEALALVNAPSRLTTALYVAQYKPPAAKFSRSAGDPHLRTVLTASDFAAPVAAG